MSLTPLEIKKIADLSLIELSDNQVLKLQKRFDGLLLLVDQIKSVCTTGIEALDHPVAMKKAHDMSLREDIVQDIVNLDMTKTNAPEMNNFLFQVPKIIE